MGNQKFWALGQIYLDLNSSCINYVSLSELPSSLSLFPQLQRTGMKEQYKKSTQHCVGHILSMPNILAIIVIISFIRMHAELNEITSVESLALGEAQQTLVSFTSRKIQSFPNLLEFQVLQMQSASLQPPNNTLSSLFLQKRMSLCHIPPPFPLVLFQQVFCTLLPKHLFSLHWDISFKFFLSLSFLVRSQILPSDHPLLFPPLLLCVLPSIPEVLITQTHFSTAKQRHLRLNQLCLSQKGYIYNAEIGADRCVLSQEIKAMTHKSDRCEQPKQIC